MPINLVEWESMIKSSKGFGIKSRAIEIFLRNNKEHAYTVKEIYENIKQNWKSDITEKRGLACVTQLLTVLHKNKVVENKVPYWKIKELEENK